MDDLHRVEEEKRVLQEKYDVISGQGSNPLDTISEVLPASLRNAVLFNFFRFHTHKYTKYICIFWYYDEFISFCVSYTQNLPRRCKERSDLLLSWRRNLGTCSKHRTDSNRRKSKLVFCRLSGTDRIPYLERWQRNI